MKYKAETWDLMQKNFENFNDHCLHGIIHLNNSLNIQSLQKAITEICRIIPLLTSKSEAGMVGRNRSLFLL
jgi:NRPS condensation-like uncharacterized protein